MTNYEMIKNQDIYAMALSLMCPYDMRFLDDCRHTDNRSNISCNQCILEWLQEESL